MNMGSPYQISTTIALGKIDISTTIRRNQYRARCLRKHYINLRILLAGKISSNLSKIFTRCRANENGIILSVWDKKYLISTQNKEHVFYVLFVCSSLCYDLWMSTHISIHTKKKLKLICSNCCEEMEKNNTGWSKSPTVCAWLVQNISQW